MAKRRKKARRSEGKKARDRKGTPAGDPDEIRDPDPDAEDPLALGDWPGKAASEEESAERERFERAWADFQRGDFRTCGAEARVLADEATSLEVRRRAGNLLNRFEIDPLALGMAAVALALLLGAVIWTFA